MSNVAEAFLLYKKIYFVGPSERSTVYKCCVAFVVEEVECTRGVMARSFRVDSKSE